MTWFVRVRGWFVHVWNWVVHGLDKVGKLERPPSQPEPARDTFQGFLVLVAIAGLVSLIFGAVQLWRGHRSTELLNQNLERTNDALVLLTKNYDTTLEALDVLTQNYAATNDILGHVNAAVEALQGISKQTLQILRATFRQQLGNLEAQNHKVLFADVDGDGVEEGIVGYENTSTDSGIIRVFSLEGPVQCEMNTFKKYDAGSGAQRPNTAIVTMLVEDIDGDKMKEIVAAANDPFWFLSRVVVVDPLACTIERDYVHAGRQDRLKVISLVGENYLVMGGNNNSYPVPAGQLWYDIALLDPAKLTGQGPSGPIRDSTTGQDIPVVKEAHLWYFLVAPPGTIITDVSMEDGDRDGVLDIAISHRCGYTFYLDGFGSLRALGAHTQQTCGDPGQSGVGLIKIKLTPFYSPDCVIPVKPQGFPVFYPYPARPIPFC